MKFRLEDGHDHVIPPLAVRPQGFALDAFLHEAATTVAAEGTCIIGRDPQTHTVQLALREGIRQDALDSLPS